MSRSSESTIVRPRAALSTFGWAAVTLMAVTAAATRIVNAFAYRTGHGFDSVQNVVYVKHLMATWTLPPPDAAWATANPPLFYYASAAMGRGFDALGSPEFVLVAVPIALSALAFLTAGGAQLLVARVSPEEPRRAWLAAALVLFLPVQIYMCAMFNPEVLAATLSSLAIVGACLVLCKGSLEDDGLAATKSAALIGVLAGAALLTKLSGLLVIAAIAAAWGLAALRTGRVRQALTPIATMALIALTLGGWFYARNLLLYGYVYPQDLPVHALMFEMPPGKRTLMDYFYVPLTTWTDPQLLDPGLLRSVWGSTYATLWFDGHRHFLPNTVAASRWGTWLLTLGVVPTLAFVVGAARGAKRLFNDPRSIDGPLLALLTLTVAGYVSFTMANPWFATLKASYLLVATIPFVYYTSESLSRWASNGRFAAAFIGTILGLLFITTTWVFTIGILFTKLDELGLPWRAAG